jgi:hypothetical protein
MEQGMLNNQQREQMQRIAALGRNEDTYLAHVAPDEMIVPAQALRDNPLLKIAIEKSISNYGIDPNQFLVGNGSMDLNPLTGLPEFGFLSKMWKKAKKVIKKVAPVALLIPGVGQALGAVGGSLLGKIGLGNVASGIGGLVGSIPGLGGVGSAITGGAGGTLGNALSFGGGAIKSGIASLNPFTEGGMFKRLPGDKGATPQILKTIGDQFGFGGRSQVLENAGYTPQAIAALKNQGDAAYNAEVEKVRQANGGSFFGNKTPGAIKGIEDTAKRIFQGNNSDGGMFGGNLGLMGLSALAGKIAYDSAKDRMGGLAETPKVTMDQLGRYQMAQNLGTGGSRADFGLAPAPVALNFAKGDAVEMEDYINKMTNELIESYKKDKKYRESGLLPASYIMNEEEEASSEAAKRNDPMIGLKPSYHLVKGVIRILTGESGNRIPQRKIDEIKNMVRSSVKEKQMTQMGFNMGGMAELDMRDGGESDGPGTGTSDDIPAMLSDGEFVMTAKATKGAGAFGVNKTKSGIELIKGGSPSRKKGVENMRELMNIFEAI